MAFLCKIKKYIKKYIKKLSIYLILLHNPILCVLYNSVFNKNSKVQIRYSKNTLCPHTKIKINSNEKSFT